jgi:hypothetical protein
MATTMKVSALFGKKSAPVKKAQSGAKKAAKQVAKQTSGTRKSGGWLGSGSNSIDLDKW